MKKRLILLLSLLTCSVAVFAQNSTDRKASARPDSAASKPVTVSFCRLVRNPSLYLEKLIRIRVDWVAFIPDSEGLINTSCMKGASMIQPEFDCDSEASCNQLRESLKGRVNSPDVNILEFDGRVDLILVGRLKARQSLYWATRPPGCTKGIGCYSFYIQSIERAILVKTPIPWEK